MKCLLGIALMAALLGACRRDVVAPEQSVAYQQARRGADAGDWATAAGFYRQLLDEHPKFARGHLELALLCDERLNDPIAAIYHYRRYLELEPNSDKRRVVEDFIERAKLSLAAKLPQPGSVDGGELLRLQNQNTALAGENAALKSKLAEYEALLHAPAQPALTNAAVTLVTNPPSSITVKPRIHVVQKGDTLFSIATRYYGSPAGWQKIYQANQSVLPNKDQLKIGQQLTIP